MAKTLLAVDDSVTMRKVLEITFSGEDYKVVTADSSQAALGKMSEKPAVVVIDTALGSDDGYALAKEVRKRDGGATIVLLSSRYSPYDAGKGKDAGADDYIDKPFDTQQLIDKVKKAAAARASGGAPAAAASPAPPAAAAKPAAQPAAAAAAPKPTQQSMGGSARAATMVFGDMAPPPAKPAAAAPAQPAPTPSPAKAAPAAAAAAVSAQVNGNLAGKLSELGLTPQQADAVLALSREVVERVVWEVVPQIAEAIIKEEITRLTKE